jgi:SAM-dependent methyltransferase
MVIALSRVREPEWMDQPGVDRGELARSLEDLQRVNRWLGGTRVALAPVLPLLRSQSTRRIRVLDVATGSADIPLALARWARKRRVPLEIVATDLHEGTLAVARAHAAGDPAVRVEAADALSLPYAAGEFDIAMCHTALHHFDPPEAKALLRELGRVAASAVVVSDLVRSWTGLVGVHLLSRTLWRGHPITQHDGPSSFRAAYTPGELRIMASEAALRAVRVRRHFQHARMTLAAAPPAAAAAAGDGGGA